MGAERVLELAGHRGDTTDRFRRVASAKLFICEDEGTIAASLERRMQICDFVFHLQ